MAKISKTIVKNWFLQNKNKRLRYFKFKHFFFVGKEHYDYLSKIKKYFRHICRDYYINSTRGYPSNIRSKFNDDWVIYEGAENY